VSDDGRHALTIITFVGSVFSPYYTWALARGDGRPDNHCALNVALYGGPEARWTMTERGERYNARDADGFDIGPSRVSWTGSHLQIDVEERGAPLPRRVRGRVRVYPGALTTFQAALDPAGAHRWRPIAPCARIEVEFDSPRLSWKGHAYIDSNDGDEPIARPFSTWDWARALLDDGSAAVLYDVRLREGEMPPLALRFAPDGSVESFAPAPRRALGRTAWGIERNLRSDPGTPMGTPQSLENAPFYARSRVTAHLLGRQVDCMHETLDARRLDTPVVRMMLPFRMPRVG
jgi:carotenoid 1,2-hydratase